MAVHGEIGWLRLQRSGSLSCHLPTLPYAILYPLQNGQTRGTINTVAMPTRTLSGEPNLR